MYFYIFNFLFILSDNFENFRNYFYKHNHVIVAVWFLPGTQKYNTTEFYLVQKKIFSSVPSHICNLFSGRNE